MAGSPSIENVSDYFDVSDFSDSATIDGSEITGILDQGWVGDRPDGVAGESIVFYTETAELPSISEKVTTIITGGTTYKIMLHQKETGVSLLHLQE